MSEVDPLSPATRAAKRNLLATSMLALTYKVFRVTITTMSTSGLTLNFEKGAFAFLLISSDTYFLIAFALYWWIDIKNLPLTDHQRDRKLQYHGKRNNFREQCIQELLSKLRGVLPKDITLDGFTEADFLTNIFSSLEVSLIGKSSSMRKAIRKLYHRTTVSAAGGIMTYGGVRSFNARLTRRDGKEIYRKIREIEKEALEKYYWNSLSCRVSLWPSQIKIAAPYIARNVFIDGILPLIIGGMAIAAFYDVIHVEWVARILPIDMRPPPMCQK